MDAPQIAGILEAALYVADLDRSVEFYGRVLGLRPLDREGSRMRTLSAGNCQVLLLFKTGETAAGATTPGGFIPGHGGQGPQHLAFSIAADQVEDWERRLEREGVALESKVRWPRGGWSLYLRDPDGHSLELVTPGCWPVY
jgi:catechol 2,3-dioxygenase-like lactoylglutathione lyase family enzyme